ncbi:hypothetical protein LDENG_00266200, partial [Lucifuga dentata]
GRSLQHLLLLLCVFPISIHFASLSLIYSIFIHIRLLTVIFPKHTTGTLPDHHCFQFILSSFTIKINLLILGTFLG